jgi:hypothetical protein
VALVTLTVVPTQLEAEMLCGELRANGIECTFEVTNPAAAVGQYGVGQAGMTAVLVEEEQRPAALRLLPDNE